MKKNLFLLFAIYFFVIQAWIIAFLRSETKFFALGIINLGVIIIVILSYSYFEKSEKKPEENSSFKKERESILSEKLHKKSNPKNKLFRISMIFAIIAFLFFKGYLLSSKLIIASGIGFILFIAMFYISNLYKHHKFLKLRNTKIYLLIFILGLIISGFDASTLENKQESAVACIINIVSNGGKYITKDIQIPQEEYQEENNTIQNISGNTQEENTQDGGIDTGEKIFTGNITNNISTTNKNYLNDGDLTILDAIRYLFSDNNIPLDTKQNVKFNYISYSNPNYPYFKTAFMKKMIGTSTNPDKAIICQTYIVMKGISKSRDIGASTNTLQAYRDKANELGELNGCKWNKYVELDNL